MGDELLLYPIFEKELPDEKEALESTPFYEAEPDTTENKKVDVSDFIREWVDSFVERLSKDEIKVEKNAENDLSKLFVRAIEAGDAVNGSADEEFIKDIATKLEFQLMLKGTGDERLVTKADVSLLAAEMYDKSSSANEKSDDIIINKSDLKGKAFESVHISEVGNTRETREKENADYVKESEDVGDWYEGIPIEDLTSEDTKRIVEDGLKDLSSDVFFSDLEVILLTWSNYLSGLENSDFDKRIQAEIEVVRSFVFPEGMTIESFRQSLEDKKLFWEDVKLNIESQKDKIYSCVAAVIEKEEGYVKKPECESIIFRTERMIKLAEIMNYKYSILLSLLTISEQAQYS